MNIGIDITFLFQDKRGMGRYTREVIEALLRLKGNKSNEALEYYFLSERDLRKDLRNDKEFSPVSFIHYKREKDAEFLDALWHPWNRIDFLGAKKNIVNIHDTLPFTEFTENISESYIKKDKERLCTAAKRADAIIVLSFFAKSEIIKNLSVKGEKIKIIPPGISSFFVKKKYSECERKKILDKYVQGAEFILYVGAYDKRKNWTGLLKSFSVLKEKYNITQKLVIVGSMPRLEIFSQNNEKKEVLALLKYYKNRGEVCLIEEINNADLTDLYNLADVFVFPSFYEGFGLPVLEAQICGAPVAAADAASLPEAAGQGARFFNPHNELDISDAIYAILRDESLRTKIVENGFENIKKFSYEKCAREMLRLFSDE